MKISDIFSKIYQFYVRYFIPYRNLFRNFSLIEQIRILIGISIGILRHLSSPLEKKIDMEDLYQIVGHVDEKYLLEYPSNIDKHPIDMQKPESKILPNIPLLDWESYINRIEESGFENHIMVEKEPKNVLISEKDIYYFPKYKITVKNLIISVYDSDHKREMFFYPPSSSSDSTSDKSVKEGIYLIFENNYFVGKDKQIPINFYPKENAYFIFKKNMFIFVNLLLATEHVPKIELKGNIFIDSDAEISKSARPRQTKNIIQSVFCLDDNIFYRRDRNSSILKIITDNCYFKGKNTVDNLILELNHLHWGGHQNIDSQGKHAYTHKKMFISFMEKTIKSNDKMQETRLRRELMKCESALLREENIWHSLQDKIILWWSGFISDYGISWFRPFSWLFIMNASLASVIVYFFYPNFSWSTWSILFAEFYNPLSHLSDTLKLDALKPDAPNIEESNGLISSINIVQKALLALFLYEMIKIFRRFAK